MDIELVRFERPAPVAGMHDAERKNMALVTFRVSRGLVHNEVPILINRKDFDDAELVRAGRHFLHQFALDLAKATESWEQPAGFVPDRR